MSQKHLKWDSHNKTLLEILHSYCMKEEMTDTTLRFQDGKINAHRIILSACSATFESILKESGTSEIYLCHVLKSSMNYLIEFMYKGHVVVPSDALAGVLQAAEYFQVKGIQTATGSQNSQSQQMEITSNNLQKEQNGQSCVVKRRYGSPSSPVRRDRPRPKNPTKIITAISPPTPERDKIPFRRGGNTSGNMYKSDDMATGKQNTSDLLSSPKRKVTPTRRTSSVTKEESHSKISPKVACQLFSNSEKYEQSSRRANTTHSEDNCQGSSNKGTRLIDGTSKVVNPFAKKATILESPDSDSTIIGASVAHKENDTEAANNSEAEKDVEILEVDDAPIEIMESFVEPANFAQIAAEPANSEQIPDSDDSFDLACAPSQLRLEPSNTGAGASTSRKARQPGENFSDTDEDLPCSADSKRRKISTKKTVKKREEDSVELVVIKKTPPVRSGFVTEKQLEKYTKDLLKKALCQMHRFCPVCFKYAEDGIEHIKKRHKTMSKKMYPCKICEKEFFDKSFFNFHLCIRQEKD